jgi:hypothetical protein
MNISSTIHVMKTKEALKTKINEFDTKCRALSNLHVRSECMNMYVSRYDFLHSVTSQMPGQKKKPRT